MRRRDEDEIRRASDGMMDGWMDGLMDGWMDGCVVLLLVYFAPPSKRYSSQCERGGEAHRLAPPAIASLLLLFTYNTQMHN